MKAKYVVLIIFLMIIGIFTYSFLKFEHQGKEARAVERQQQETFKKACLEYTNYNISYGNESLPLEIKALQLRKLIKDNVSLDGKTEYYVYEQCCQIVGLECQIIDFTTRYKISVNIGEYWSIIDLNLLDNQQISVLKSIKTDKYGEALK